MSMEMNETAQQTGETCSEIRGKTDTFLATEQTYVSSCITNCHCYREELSLFFFQTNSVYAAEHDYTHRGY